MRKIGFFAVMVLMYTGVTVTAQQPAPVKVEKGFLQSAHENDLAEFWCTIASRCRKILSGGQIHKITKIKNES
jgi:hypothetical protein